LCCIRLSGNLTLKLRRPIERLQRVRDQLERPRRKRGERRTELCATIGPGIGMPTPLAREHHGDEHIESLQAVAAVSKAAVVTVLHADVTGVVWQCMRGLGSSAAPRHWAHAVPHLRGA
jgi:hypothetical protein